MNKALLLFLAIALAVPACGGSTDTPLEDLSAQDLQTDSDLNEADVLIPNEVVETWFSEEVEAGLTRVVDDFALLGRDPGGVGVALIKGDRIWSGNGGFRDMAEEQPIGDLVSFKVGSATKPFIAVLVMMLVEEGTISLDDTLDKFLPQYEEWSEVTIEDLLGMTSGVPELLLSLDLTMNIFTDPSRVFTPAQVVEYTRSQETAFQPGEQCVYSNTNYILLGMIIEKLTGNTIDQELESRILGPLGLEHTYLEAPAAAIDHIPHGYVDLGLFVTFLKLPEMFLTMVPSELYLNGTGVFDGNNQLNPSITWAAGALVTTPADLAIFLRALMNGELLKQETLDLMTVFKTCKVLGMDTDYGLGLMQYPSPYGPMLGHEGVNLGFHSRAFYVPSQDLTITELHSFLPAQMSMVTAQAFNEVLGTPAGDSALCDLPGDLFKDDGEPRLNLRFSGPLGENPGDRFTAGVSGTEVSTGGAFSRFYGIDRIDMFTSAVLGTEGQVVEITAPGATAEGEVALFVVRIQEDAFARIDENGRLPLVGEAGVHAFLASLELEEPEDPTQISRSPARYCVTHAAATAEGDSLQFCGDNPPTATLGSLIRVAGTITLTQDQELVDRELTAAGLAPCMCMKDSGWVPCD